MSVVQGVSGLPYTVKKACVGIGVFDGVHWGHRAILEKVLETAAQGLMTSVVLTFDKHPAEVLAPARAPNYVSSLQQRTELILQTGIEYVVVAEFNEKLAQIPKDQFVNQILLHNLRAGAVVVGANFRFGRQRQGDIRYLRAMSGSTKIETVVVSSVIIDGLPVSSTRIRSLLAKGDISAATKLLGHTFVLRGTVVRGRQVGRQLGFPTANLSLSEKQALPLLGVYAVNALIDSVRYAGVCSVGKNPTFNGNKISVEVHLLDFDADIYGKTVDVEFLERIRGEIKFDSPGELIKQINRDICTAEGLNGFR